MKKINRASVFSLVLLLGILVLINIIGLRYFIRADLTSSKMYSLSKASKTIVGNIEDKLLIKAYFSPDLPGQYGGVERYLRDMLEDYRAYSHGHLDYQFINPGSEEALEKEAQSFQIPPITAQSVENDKIEVKKVYMGVVFIYGDKKETIPTITSIANLEYEITSLIHRLTTAKQPVAGIASTGSEQERRTMQQLYEALGRIYDVRPVSLDDPIDAAFDGVFVLAPRQPFTDWQLFNLDQFIMRGGKVGMFMNSYNAQFQSRQAVPSNLNVNAFLNNFGLGLGEDIVFDFKSSMVNVQSRQGFFTISQPVQFVYLPIIETFNRQNTVTRDLQGVRMFFPSSVDTTLAKEKGYDVQVLMYTSEHSGRRMGPYIMIDPLQQLPLEDYNEKFIPVAAVVKGTFTSSFAQSGPPIKKDQEGKEMKYDGPFIESAEKENRILVVGDGNMVLDEFVQSPRDLLFFQNASDWLLQSEDLISIRSKEVKMEPLKDVPAVVKNLVKWANRIIPAILIIIIGIVLWQVRRFRNKMLIANYRAEVNE